MSDGSSLSITGYRSIIGKKRRLVTHYCDVIMSPTACQITSVNIVYSIVYSGTDQRKHQSPASLAFVRVIHRRPVNSPHKWPVTRKMFPFDDAIMNRDNPSSIRRKLNCGKLLPVNSSFLNWRIIRKFCSVQQRMIAVLCATISERVKYRQSGMRERDCAKFQLEAHFGEIVDGIADP